MMDCGKRAWSGDKVSGGKVMIEGKVKAEPKTDGQDVFTAESNVIVDNTGSAAGQLIINADQLSTASGSVTVSLGNGGSLLLTGGELNATIKKKEGTTGGETYLVDGDWNPTTVKFTHNAAIEGSLYGMGGTIDLTEDGEMVSIPIEKYGGDIKLKIDVVLGAGMSDKLKIGTITYGSIDLTEINVLQDISLGESLTLPSSPEERVNAITYVSDATGTGDAPSATYKINGSTDGTIEAVCTVTNNFKYVFSKGTKPGKLSYTVNAIDMTFKKFVEGGLVTGDLEADPPVADADPATLSLTANLANTGEGSNEITMGLPTQTNDALTINLNNYALTSQNSTTITVGGDAITGKSIKINGGATGTAGSIDSNTNFEVKSGNALALEGNLVVNGTITNAASEGVTVAGTVNTKGAITGAGSLKISGGTLTADAGITQTAGITVAGANDKLIIGADNLLSSVTNAGIVELTGGTLNSAAITNNGTVKLNGATLGGKYVTAGTLEFATDTTINADYVAAVTNKVDSGVTLELNGGTLNKTVDNGGTVKLNGATLGGKHVTAGTLEFAKNTTINADYVAAVTNKVDSGVTLELTGGTLNEAVDNGGTVKLNGATLGGAHVTAGTLEFATDTTINADYVAATTNMVDSGKTLTLTDGILGGEVTGTGNLLVNGDVSAEAGYFSNTLTAVTVNADKTLTLTGGTLNKAITNNGTVKLSGATLGGKFVEAGTLEFTEDTTINADYVAAGTNKVDDGKTLTLTAGTLNNDVDNSGTVKLSGATLGGAHVTTGNLEFAADTTIADAGYISTATNKVDSDVTLELTGGTLNNDVDNSGTVKLNGATLGGAHITNGTLEFAQNTTINADYVAADTNTVDTGVTIELTAGTLNKYVDNSGIVKLNGATLGGAHVTAGTLEFAKDIIINADYVAAAINKVDSGVTLELTGGTLNEAVDNGGTVKLNGATLGGAHVTAGTLEFATDTTINADYVAAANNVVDSGKTLTLTEGTLAKDVTNNGTVKTNGNVTVSGKLNGGTAGKLVVEGGKLLYTNTAGGSITNNVEIKAGATMTPDAGTFANGTTVTNYGTLEITGGVLTATIDGKGDDNLVMNGQMAIGAGGVVKQAAKSNITVQASTIEAETNDAAKAMFTGVDDASKLNVSEGSLTITGNDVNDGMYYVLVAGNAVNSGAVTEDTIWKLDNIDFKDMALTDYEVKYDVGSGAPGSIALHVKSTMTVEEANTSGLAAVQQGAMTMCNEIVSGIVDNMGLINRPYLGAGNTAKVRNVASTVKDDYKVETVEQGKANEVMPVQLVEKDKYDKTVWASYIRTKETTEGMKLGKGLDGSNTAQYNGAVVGVDFYSSKKAIAGAALSYVAGDINSHSNGTSTVNKSKYYGIALYDRVTNGNTAWIYDLGFVRGNNDINQYHNGKDTTSDVKTNTYTAGAKWETVIATGRSKLVPFAAFRYMRINNGDYTNSHNVKIETGNQNLYIPKVGIAWTGDFVMPKSVWGWRPSVEVGYVWNLGDRNAESNFFVGTRTGNLDYDVADKSSYYTKAGMEFINKHFTAGVFYRYLKGSAVRNNKWNINVSWSF